jgi:hypothetical protein
MHTVSVARKAFLSALVALALLAGALFVAAPQASADESCIANQICIWDQIEYRGSRFSYPCENVGNYSTPFGNQYRSAKNRCGSKYNVLNTPWGGVCMGPGGDRPSPGYFQSIAFLNWGQRC